MGIASHWTPNCQGKQNFDGPVVELSIRYWPRGDGFITFDSQTGECRENKVEPSATSAFVIRDVDHDFVLVEAKFEAETWDEVKRQVEAWANDQYAKITGVLKQAFAKARCPECGYTWEDARVHGDHRICSKYPFFPDERDLDETNS